MEVEVFPQRWQHWALWLLESSWLAGRRPGRRPGLLPCRGRVWHYLVGLRQVFSQELLHSHSEY